MAESRSSSNWRGEELRQLLKAEAARSGTATASVFFDDSVGSDVAAAAQTAIAAAKRVVNKGDVVMSNVRRMARSVSVKGDPDVIAEMEHLPNVKAVLPSHVEDSYPRPVKVVKTSDR